TFTLVLAIGVFSFFMRILNISINTQTITLQKNFKRKIIGSFHGIWSTGGLAGVGFSTLMVKTGTSMETHLAIVAVFTFFAATIAYNFLIKDDPSPYG